MERIFVLGAGFSKACGFPLAKELFKEVWDFCQVDQILFDEEQRRKFFAGLELLGEPFDGLVPYPEFEPILMKAMAFLRKHGGGNEVFDVCRILKEGTRRYLYSRLQGSASDLAPAKTFLSKLDRTKDVIISLNWDLIIELAFHELKGDEYCSYSQSISGFLVLKPHGSINWRLFGRNLRVERASLDVYELYPGKGIWVFQGFSDYDPSYILDDNQHMILPGSKDEPQKEGMRKVWDEVKAYLSQARTIVFVGYSMPDYDEYATKVFRDTICPRLQNTHARPELEVIDPDVRVLEKYRSFFGNQIKLIKSRFEDTEYVRDP